MTIGIEELRADKGGDPERVRDSEKRRFRDGKLVDEVCTPVPMRHITVFSVQDYCRYICNGHSQSPGSETQILRSAVEICLFCKKACATDSSLWLEVIALDQEWVKANYAIEQKKKEKNAIQKEITDKKKASKGKDHSCISTPVRMLNRKLCACPD
eukprot:5343737-Amphidinium_carterae.1